MNFSLKTINWALVLVVLATVVVGVVIAGMITKPKIGDNNEVEANAQLKFLEKKS